MLTKQELRKIMKGRLSSLPEERFATEGKEAAKGLVKTEAWGQYRRVLLFLSMAGEIGMDALLALAFEHRKDLYLPRTEGEAMRFYRVDSPQGRMAQGPWTTGAFGIREPADCSSVRLFRGEDGPALVVTPGLAFDKKGRRMGRGGGYYDKFFASLDGKGAAYYSVGFCLASQVIEEVPVDSHDKRLDALCTAEGFWSFS